MSMEETKKRRIRRKFTEEFKAGALRLVLKGSTVAQVGRDLDVGESVLHAWVKQAQIDRGMGVAGALTSEERAELSQLRKENRILREERDILKKAAAFFAKEPR